MNALCKLSGMLVLFEVSKTKEPDGRGCCPVCGSKCFEEYNGWVECRGENCDFAVLKEHTIRVSTLKRQLLLF